MRSQRFAALILIIFGAILLVARGIEGEISLVQLWPLLLIASGVITLTCGKWIGRLALIPIILIPFILVYSLSEFLGFLVTGHGLWLISYAALLPVLVLSVGLVIFWGGWPFIRARAIDQSRHLNVASIFSGINECVDGSGFTGGNVYAIFGWAAIDLRSADIVGGATAVNAMSLAGSINFRVPADWAVDVRSSVVFGSIESKRLEPREPKARLVITGSCWFGDIQITS